MNRRSRSSGKSHKIHVVGEKFIEGRRAEFDREIRKAFEGSTYSEPEYGIDDVIGTSIGENMLKGDDIRNVVATDESGKILGAVFRISVKKNIPTDHAGIGWFFTSKGMGPRQRVEVSRSMFDETHSLMKRAGYKGIVASIGTKEGEKYLGKREGWKAVGKDPGGRQLWHKEI